VEVSLAGRIYAGVLFIDLDLVALIDTAANGRPVMEPTLDRRARFRHPPKLTSASTQTNRMVGD
jgi:hypothetical protein